MSPVAPPEVLATQRQASDPAVSAWVSANAGSGKTYVLAQRVIRLLLDGTAPEKILCLTFTKAAAANMANRVFSELSRWTALGDAALDQAMRGIGVGSVDAARRARARRLFAQALETPGGLKVQTIHAFCTRLLHQFPFEADVTARFDVLDEHAQKELLGRARFFVLIEAAGSPGRATGRALTTATAAVSDATFEQAVDEAIRQRDKIAAWLDGAGSLAGAIAELCHALQVRPDDSIERVDDEIANGKLFPLSEWMSVAVLFTNSSANDQKQGDRLSAAAAATGAARIAAYLSVFFTGEFEPRKSILTAPLAKKIPDVAEILFGEQARLEKLLERRRAVLCRDNTEALLTIANEVIRRYQAEKERRGALDYDDLIAKTLNLLTRVDAAWVHYKLDLGIDHVLIDEAQDTSPRQWDIIEKLVAEFTAGVGARDGRKRSIFAVGDEKQSIFSFQGAAPDAFARMRRSFMRAYERAELPFAPVELKYSFRSLQIILDAVDAVFKRPAAFHGLTAETEQIPTAHTAVRAQAPGQVEIWPLEQPVERPATRPWDAPFDTATRDDPRVTLAYKIARAVGAWITRGDPVGEGERRHAVRPGDILILVRQRGPLFEAIIRALKNAEVPVAGADRLVLTEHIAVMDLLALGDALLLPEDDLALATVLKSPLFGLDDNDLFTLADARTGSLRASLRAQQGPRFTEVSARLDAYSQWAQDQTPFAFYARVLGADQGRAKILARLGGEAIDALDEFLELALDYERREVASLQGFVHWMRAANAEIKRDMEMDRDEVRVMTVHGAKGLEAPIVIVADTTSPPAGPPQRQPKLIALPAENAAPGTPDRIIFAARKADDVPAIASARLTAATAAEHEHRRLLYVAMTRAADRLIVCGAIGEREMAKDCWYDLITQALQPEAVEAPADHGQGTVWRWRKALPEAAAPAPKAAAPAPIAMPEWLTREAPGAPHRVALTPSADEGVAVVSPAASREDRRRAMLRGTIMHRLLQSLPELAPERRIAAGQLFLSRAALEFSAEERETLRAQALDVMDDARFARAFAPGARAEVSIAGRLNTVSGKTIVISGQIDRLAITADEVLIVDYKTNRPAPRGIEQVPPSYLRQLALYRALLMKIYPNHVVRAALIWTDVPDLMELSTELLDRELARITSA